MWLKDTNQLLLHQLTQMEEKLIQITITTTMGIVTQIQMKEAHQIQTLTLDQLLIMLLLEHARSLLNTKETETMLIHSLVLRL